MAELSPHLSSEEIKDVIHSLRLRGMDISPRDRMILYFNSKGKIPSNLYRVYADCLERVNAMLHNSPIRC